MLQEAQDETIQMIKIYEEFARTKAAMPVIVGRKSRIESFAGANATYTIEAMMGDCKALQVRTVGPLHIQKLYQCRPILETQKPKSCFFFVLWFVTHT